MLLLHLFSLFNPQTTMAIIEEFYFILLEFIFVCLQSTMFYLTSLGLKFLMSLCQAYYVHAAAAKLLQSCPTLGNPIDGSPPGFPIPGILQARTLEGVAISFSNALKWKVKVKTLSRIRLLVTPWTAAHQVPPSMGFSRQEYWSGVPLPSPIMSIAYGINSLR